MSESGWSRAELKAIEAAAAEETELAAATEEDLHAACVDFLDHMLDHSDDEIDRDILRVLDHQDLVFYSLQVLLRERRDRLGR